MRSIYCMGNLWMRQNELNVAMAYISLQHFFICADGLRLEGACRIRVANTVLLHGKYISILCVTKNV